MARVIRVSVISAMLAAQLVALPAVRAEPAVQTAENFAQQLVQRMNTESWVNDRSNQDVDPSFERLMDQNNRLARGEDLLDADPICQCQDSGRRYQLLSITPRGATTNARIGLDDGSHYTLVLRQSGAHWLIYDVINDGHSVRAQLTSHNACMRVNHSDAAMIRCFNAH